MPRLFLASSSPRRHELLGQMGIRFDAVIAPVDESPLPGEQAGAYVERLALAKARAGLELLQDPEAVVLGADTTVVLDGVLLGKPGSREEGLAMLRALSGRTHQVLTAIAVVTHERQASQCVASDVCFRELVPGEAEAYWATGEPCDKAGGYAIQGLGGSFVQHLQGSYSGVVGLPLCETLTLLRQHGIADWSTLSQ